MLLTAASFAGAQTAHFDGAQTPSISAGYGTDTLSIAVDAAGDVVFTVQTPSSNNIASLGGRSAQYVPAAFHPARARRYSDGGYPATAQKLNASSCTYSGYGSMLFVRPANSSTVYMVSGLNAPLGVAFDPSGDLYVLDDYTGAIYKYLGANGALQIQSVSTSGATLAGPYLVAQLGANGCSGTDIARDATGNLYYTTFSGNAVEEILAVNGVIPASPTIRTLGRGFNFPTGIAVDNSGNVYVADSFNKAVKEMLAVNGSIPASPTIVTLGRGFNMPIGVALDSRGDVYVADANNNALTEIMAVDGTIPPSPTMDLLGVYSQTEAVTLDPGGNVFFGFAGQNGGTVDELAAAGANFGEANIGTMVPAIPMIFTFDSSGTLGGISVLTQGASGLDYANTGSGTCTTKTTYFPGQSCTVNVSFTPKFSGTRNGAVVLTATNGSVIATGYLQGTGVGPQVNFLPGAQSVLGATGILNPTGVAVDGAGSVYLVDTGNNRVLKETLQGGAYTQSTVTSNVVSPQGVAIDGSGAVYIADTGNGRVPVEAPTTSGGYSETAVASGLGNPSGVAVDGSGNVYITDSVNGLIVKETLAAGSYTQSTIVTGLSSPDGVAVDGSGNIYIADTNNNRVVKETLAGGSFTQSILPSTGMMAPTGISVDGNGNVYVVFQNSFLVLKETPSGASYTPTTVVSGLNSSSGPFGVAVDSSGNLYVGDEGNNRVVKEDFADAPSLMFANTPAGSTSSDSPQTVTIANNGNAALTFPIPAKGNNPAIGPDFTLSSSGQTDCTVLTSQSASSATLAPGSTCDLPVSFAPAAGGTFTESLTWTDNNLNAASPAYTSQTITLSGASGNQTTPAVTWPLPAAIPCGTPLGAAQLDASSTVPGTFSYSPAAGTVLGAGTQTLTVTFTPTDTTSYTTTTATVTLTVNQVTPAVTWSTPAAVTYGTALGSAQLDASSTVAGTFSYSPAAGTVVGAGTQTLTATFTPTDTADYTTATATVTLTVTKATPTITWNTPAAITYGIALGSAQLDAISTVWGSFSYSQPAGTVLTAGQQSITATFTPGDPADYTTATATVTLTVNQARPAITWGTPAAIKYGTALGSAQLDASSSVAGTFTYSPAGGTVPGAGTQTLTATFSPTDSTDYTTATATVSLTVNQATPAITWSAPAAITYGTPLGSAQLDASSTVAGTFAYSPAAGTVLGAGTQTLTVTFTPTDTTDYTTATATVTLTVNKATPAITWSAPAAITYGTALGSAQLDASSTVAGTFIYSPATGTVLAAGTQTLSATFTPTDTTDYTTSTASVTLTVNKATPAITWSAPSAIAYGTALSSTQLAAGSNVAGTFSYSPGSGTVLAAGTQTLTATFTPTDSTDYTTATASVSLTVNKAAPSVTWPAPGAIVYGTALSSAQLDATATIAGSFTYSPAAGTVLSAGTQTLSVTFNPADSRDYSPVTTTASLTVNKATPTIMWPTPASITAGTALSSVQLDATASVSGSFVYSPAAGTVLAAGSQTLTTAFTPTDSADYNAASASVVLQVTAPPSFTLSASSSTLSVSAGGSGTDGVSVIGQNGFNSSVTLSASGLPTGLTVTFGTNPTSGSSAITFSASASAAPGTYSVTVKGVSGSLSATTVVSVTIQSGFACHVGYSIVNSWPGGFQVGLSINNTGTVAISNWTLTWTFANGQKVTQLWNGNESQNGANVTVTNMSYNGSIAAGASYTGAGFNGSWNNVTNAIPTSFAINGTTCH